MNRIIDCILIVLGLIFYIGTGICYTAVLGKLLTALVKDNVQEDKYPMVSGFVSALLVFLWPITVVFLFIYYLIVLIRLAKSRE